MAYVVGRPSYSEGLSEWPMLWVDHLTVRDSEWHMLWVDHLTVRDSLSGICCG